jgi:hypothetical protein
LAQGKKEYGTVPGTGIPRVLDMGQCNDSYSAVVVATALAKAFGTDVNGLPLSIVLSWFEQKAVAVLLSLLSLGVKNIRIGPALPAFVTPKTLAFLQKEFNLQPIKADGAWGEVGRPWAQRGWRLSRLSGPPPHLITPAPHTSIDRPPPPPHPPLSLHAGAAADGDVNAVMGIKQAEVA